jgi:hypothetical protein
MARRSLLEHEMSDWDPMSADFYDPTFNNYTDGPGSRLDRNLLRSHSRYVCIELVLPEDYFYYLLTYQLHVAVLLEKLTSLCS